MVFTIEPGLYFSKKIKNIPASGIRIEDNILITNKGNTVLTDMFPKERNAVEEFLHNIRSDSFFDM
jgi:Xaa-Pro aminopeptidase